MHQNEIMYNFVPSVTSIPLYYQMSPCFSDHEHTLTEASNTYSDKKMGNAACTYGVILLITNQIHTIIIVFLVYEKE